MADFPDNIVTTFPSQSFRGNASESYLAMDEANVIYDEKLGDERA